MRKSISFRIGVWVLAIVIAGFSVVTVIMSNRVVRNQQKDILSSEEHRLEQYMQHISYMQETTENFGSLIAADEKFQNLYESDAGLNIYQRNKKKAEIAQFLKQYLLLRKDCYQIDLVFPDGSYYSSNAKDEEDYREKEFYQEYIKRQNSKGYSKIHDFEMVSPYRRTQSLAYIIRTQCIKDMDKESIHIVLEMNPDSFLGDFQITDDPIQAFSLQNTEGDRLVEEGIFTEEANALVSTDDGSGTFYCRNGNILLVQTDSRGQWTANLEISRKLLEVRLYKSMIFNIFIMVLDCVILLLIISGIIRRLLRPIKILETASRAVGEGNLTIKPDIRSGDEFEELGHAFCQMEENLQRYMEQALEHEKIKRDMEIDKLVLQINPHFIYNTLNTISYMAAEDGSDRIEEFTKAFIALLQDSLSGSREAYLTTLRQEMTNLENYVVLQRYRYEDKFEFQTAVPEELLDCMVPNILLQPIVENALLHGILAKDGKGLITVSAVRENMELYISVIDDGVGMSPETVEEIMQERERLVGTMRRIGTGNVSSRLHYIYGDGYGLEICSTVGEGTTVIMHLPFRQTE